MRRHPRSTHPLCGGSQRIDIVKYLVEECGVLVDRRCLRNAAEKKSNGLLDYMQQRYDLQDQEPSRLTKKFLDEHNEKTDEVSWKLDDVVFDDGSSDKELGEGAERLDLEDVDDLSEVDSVNDAGPGLDGE